MPAPKRKTPKLDRFGTLRDIFDRMQEIKSARVDGIAGGASACLAAIAVWHACDARTGGVTMTVSRLSRMTCSTRKTAARSMRILEELKIILPQVKDGKPVPYRWTVNHFESEQADTE